ncbi:MAG: hypothetical protein NC409_11740 [Clostridium sp.]|nr:hypothetical protein [Clostridium sp.]
MSGGTKKKQNVIKVVILFVALALVIGICYFRLSNRTRQADTEKDVQSTAVQEVLLRDLSSNYPPTPKEVIKYYSEISKCFYNESYTEEELILLAEQAQRLYDEELIANKTQEQYLTDLKADILEFEEAGYTIASYTTSSSVDIENSKFKQDGYEWARVYCYYTMRTKGGTARTTERFLLRKDSDGYWKIYGWELVDDEG